MKIEALVSGHILLNNFKIIDLKQVCAIEPAIDEVGTKIYYPIRFYFQGDQEKTSIQYICSSEQEQNTLLRILWDLLKNLSNEESLTIEV